MSHKRRYASDWILIFPALVACALAGATSVHATASSGPVRGPFLEGYRNYPAVRANLRYFLGPGRRSIERALSRSEPYVAMIQRHLKREGLPSELAWLPLIESGFSSAAMSSAGAAGMWQFMPGTARDYGLRVDRYVDERRDAFKATRAAVRHLRDLTDRYGSSFLAAAAYNAGPARIDRGLASLDVADARDTDFFRLSRTRLLAAETRDYVPKLIAAALIAENPRRYGLRVDGPHPGETDQSYLPPDPLPANEVLRATKHHRVIVREGDTMASVAASCGVTLSELCRANMLPATQVLRPGRILSLPTSH